MPAIDAKQWLRDNLQPVYTKIKSELAAVSSITGQYVGSASTFAGLPTVDASGAAVSVGDFAILTDDDAGNESGIYLHDGALWQFSVDLVAWGEIVADLLATDIESDAGTATDKVMSVKQVHDRFALINGNSANLFEVAAGSYDSAEAIRGDQFNSVPLTAGEVNADWAAA